MTRQPGLGLAENFGQFSDAKRPARDEREKAEPGRLGASAEQGEKGLHLDVEI